MATMTNLPNGEKGYLASPLHMLLITARNGGGFVAQGDGVSVTQLRAAAKPGRWFLKLQIEMQGRREIITGAHLTPAGLRHLEMLDAALAEQQRKETM